jgi:hypothetical protein
MAQSNFEVSKGLSLRNESTGGNTVITQGTGLGDITSTTVAVHPVGSEFTNATTGDKLLRTGTSEVGVADWETVATQEYVNGLISWREPVLVRDNTVYADITAAETAANVADEVDGETIQAGDRILFSNLTSGADNVYITSGSTGAWTFTEEANTVTPGDRLYVELGTYANEIFTYNAAGKWVADLTETSASGATLTATAINSVATGSGNLEVLWHLMIKESATPTKIEAVEVHALHTAAGVIDFSVYGKVKGTQVSGLVINVTAAGGVLSLVVTATNSASYTVQRVSTLRLA